MVKDKHLRRQIFYAAIMAFLLVVVIESLRNLMFGQLLFNNRAAEGVNGISSGRTDQVAEVFTPAITRSFWFGGGGTYIESFPLAALTSYGVIAFVPLLLFAFTPLFCVILSWKSTPDSEAYLLTAISVAFLLISIFEERAPFGPGVTYFFLWFSAGFQLCKREFTLPLSAKVDCVSPERNR